jgi:hypothetical protein
VLVTASFLKSWGSARRTRENALSCISQEGSFKLTFKVILSSSRHVWLFNQSSVLVHCLCLHMLPVTLPFLFSVHYKCYVCNINTGVWQTVKQRMRVFYPGAISHPPTGHIPVVVRAHRLPALFRRPCCLQPQWGDIAARSPWAPHTVASRLRLPESGGSNGESTLGFRLMPRLRVTSSFKDVWNLKRFCIYNNFEFCPRTRDSVMSFPGSRSR